MMEVKNSANFQLSRMGIHKNDAIIGLLIRGSNYLDQLVNSKTAFNYHSYRNSCVSAYEKGIQYLTEQGHYVIRMGTHVDDVLELDNSRYVEYENLGFRTELLDIYISSICRFFITTSTGLEVLPMYCFRKPMLFVNLSQLDVLNHVCLMNIQGVMISKKFRLISENRFLTLREILKMGVCCFWSTQQFIDTGIELVDNSPQEINDAVIEMELRLNNKWESSREDDLLQEKFWEIINSSTDSDFHLNCSVQKNKHLRNPKIKIGAQFLSHNRYLLE